MDPSARLRDGLERKKKLFERYRELTARMLTCPEEEISVTAEHRQALCREIDAVDREMEQAAAETGCPDEVMKALRLRCRRSEVPEEYRFLFDRAQEVFAVANHVKVMEPEIVARLEDGLAVLEKKIRENNRSVSAQAARFTSGAVSGGAAWGGGLSRKA